MAEPTSIRAALDRCREASDGGVEVLIHGGVYELAAPLTFTPAHSGTAGRPVRWRNAPGEQPRFCGATPVKGWRQLDHDVPGLPEDAADKVWCADVGDAVFRTLYQGNRMLQRARFGPLTTDPRRDEEATHTRLCARREDLRDWPNPTNIDLFISPKHVWQGQYLPVAEIDRDNAVIVTRLPGTYELLTRPSPESPVKYWLENVPEGLTGPGSWMLDSLRGTVYLWNSEEGKPTEVARARLTELFRFQGEPGNPCRYIELEGLAFTHGDWVHWPENRRAAQHDWQVHNWPDSMVGLHETRNMTIRHCRFVDAGASGLRMDGMAVGNTVERCDFERLGGTGIALLGNEPGQRDSSHHNTIAGNHIHETGTLWWQASGIFIHQSGSNQVINNHLHDLPYGGIALVSGREGAFGKAPGNDGNNGRIASRHAFGDSPFEWPHTIGHLACRHNRVAFNDIHHVMKKLGDGNAIYISGTGWGNLIEGNFVHDIVGNGVHSAIRTDDMQWYTRIERNVVCRCHGAGITLKHINDITDNVVVDCRRMGMLNLRRGLSWGSNLKRNILVMPAIPHWLAEPPQPFFADGGMGGRLEEANLDDTLVWCAAAPDHAEACVAALRERGLLPNARVADPCFVDPDRDDFRLSSDSPAFDLGICSLDTWGLQTPAGAELDAEDAELDRQGRSMTDRSREDPTSGKDKKPQHH